MLARLVVAQAAGALVLAATAWTAGRGLVRLLRLSAAEVPASLTLAAGLLTLAQAAVLLGLLGLLRSPLVGAIAVAGCAACAWDLLRRPPSRTDLGAALLLVVLGLPGAALTLYPPLGFDQTMYHLPMARAFAASGGLPFLPDLRYPIFPALAEALNAAILTVRDDVATQAAGWLAVVVTLGVVRRWATDVATPVAGWLAVAILAGSPLAWYLSATGYVEPLLALAAAGACAAADRARRDPHAGWLLLAGLLAGAAAGVKYLGLYFVAAAGLVAVARAPGHDPTRRDAVRRAAVYGFASAVALAPCYGRLIAHTGNPLFPFYPELFGASPWAAQEFLGRRGLERLGSAALAFWDAAFRRERIGHLPPLSPVLALGLPLVLFVYRQRAVALAAALTLGYLAVAPMHAHYLLAIAPVWSVAIASAAASLAGPSRPAVVTIGCASALIALPAAGFCIVRVQALGAPPVDAVSRDRLLAAERPLHPAVRFLNQVAPGVPVYGVGAENMVDDRIGPLLGDHNGPLSHTRLQARIAALGSIAAALDAIGVGYLLVREDGSLWAREAPADPRLVRVYGDRYATVYRVSPAGPADRDSAGPPRPD